MKTQVQWLRINDSKSNSIIMRVTATHYHSQNVLETFASLFVDHHWALRFRFLALFHAPCKDMADVGKIRNDIMGMHCFSRAKLRCTVCICVSMYHTGG